MAKVIWSPNALEHLKAIHAYIARNSTSRASAFIKKLVDAADRIAILPRASRVIPEIGDPNCREVIVSPYRIMYRIEEEAIWTPMSFTAREIGNRTTPLSNRHGFSL